MGESVHQAGSRAAITGTGSREDAPGDGSGVEGSAGRPAIGTGSREDALGDGSAVEGSAGPPAIGTLDGGVSRRLVRRCRTAASILLVIGAALVLVVVVAPWGVISALLTLTAGLLIVGSLLLLRRGALWSGVAGSLLPDATPNSAGNAAPPKRERFRPAAAPVVPCTATVGPPRPLAPGVASAPVKRRLSSSVLPIYVDDGPSPGAGALVVHARADGTLLTEGDTVLVWLAGHGGVTSLPATAPGGPTAASVRGRFVLCREADGEVFLATTRLTDSW